jgi:outer membrane murein-binding lipoprotein Lpp
MTILLALSPFYFRILMRHLRVLAAVCAAAALASCTTPREQAVIAQALNDAANEIGGLKSDVAQLQSDVDSLRQVVARQDTLISHIADVNHIPH